MATKLKFRKKGRVIKAMTQTEKENSDKIADSKRKALKAGLRISKSGRLYIERRANRSDRNPKVNL